MRSWPLLFPLTLIGALGPGCTADGRFQLLIRFPDQECEQQTAQVQLSVLDPRDLTCADLVAGTVTPDPNEILRSATFDNLATRPTPTLARVPTGPALFFIAGLTGHGGTIARGCKSAEIVAGENVEVIVDLEWVCHPDPAGEISGNFTDDDCDLLVDECASATDCDDHDDCTADSCDGQEQRCVNLLQPLPGTERLDLGTSCENNRDDDCDGLTDEADPECRSEYLYEIVWVPTTPVIDGDCAEFSQAEELTIAMSPGDFMVYRLVWDAAGVYLCAVVKDGSLDASHTQHDSALWEDDSIEVWFDTQDDGGAEMRMDDYKFFVNVRGATLDAQTEDEQTWDMTMVSQVVAAGTVNQDGDTDTGYTVELALPWQAWGIAAPAPNTRWGFELQANDRDDITSNDLQQTPWKGIPNVDANSPDGYGKALFLP